MTANDTVVIVVNYNGGNYTETLVNQLKDQVNKVIIVDNASSDHSVSSIKAEAKIVIIRNPENYGFAKAVNQAAKFCNKKFLAVINPDCEIEPGLLKDLENEFIITGQPDLIGLRIINKDGSEQRASRRNLPTYSRLISEYFPFLNKDKKDKVNIIDVPDQANYKDVEAVSGAFFMVKRSVFEEIGMMDERYFLHCEDLDLFARMKKNNKRIVWIGKHTVKHDKGHSKTKNVFVEKHKHDGMLKYYYQHMYDDWPRLSRWAVPVVIKVHEYWIRFKCKFNFYEIRR